MFLMLSPYHLCATCFEFVHASQISHVAWSVRLCVGYTDMPRKNGWTDGGAIWALTQVDPRNHVVDGVEIPVCEGAILGSCSGVSAVVCALKRIVQYSITAWQSMAMFPTSQCRLFVRYCGQGSSLLWTPALRPLYPSNAPAQGEEENW